MIIPEAQGLSGREGIEAKCASAKETPVTFIIGGRNAMIKVFRDTADLTGRQMSVSGKKCSCFYTLL